MGASTEVLSAADRNMMQTWSAVARCVAGPEAVVERAGLLLLATGEHVALFNPAFVVGAPADDEALVDGVLRHYGGRTLPFALVFREEVAPGLAPACESRGLVEHWQPPLMVLDPIPTEVPAPPEGVEIGVLGPADAAEYARVLAQSFGVPVAVANRVFGSGLVELEGFTGFVGRSGGAVVATSGLYLSDGVAGVYNVATMSEHRGRGIGAAMTWAAAALGRARGVSVSILQASAAGAPVYRRMGFAAPTRYRQFVLPHA